MSPPRSGKNISENIERGGSAPTRANGGASTSYFLMHSSSRGNYEVQHPVPIVDMNGQDEAYRSPGF